MPGRKFNANSYRFGFNGMESDDELKGTKNSYDFGARIYDPRLVRFLSVDPLANKYPYLSPYSFVANNPINAIDPSGKDVYLIIWATANGEIGHAAIAVTNYAEVTRTVVENGRTITYTEHVPDGTYTYYDLWPGNEGGVGKSNYNEQVEAAYQEKIVASEEDLYQTDVSGSEGRAPSGVLKIKTFGFGRIEQEIKEAQSNESSSNPNYNGLTHNCTDYASTGIEKLLGIGEIGQEDIPSAGTSTTPNQLWKDVIEVAAKKNLQVTILKDPGSDVNNSFLNGVSGSETTKGAGKNTVKNN